METNMIDEHRKATTRQAKSEDIDRMIEIHDICFKPPFPQDIRWTTEDLEFVITNFPEGQIIAEVEGQAAGQIIASRVSEELYRSHPPLLEFAGIDPPWGNFDAKGNTMWILEIAVDPAFKGCSAARALVEGCKQSVMSVPEIKRFGGGARIPGYAKWKVETGGSAEEYCKEVVEGRIFDPVLGPFLKFGTTFDCVVADYIPDPDSLDFGASVIWEKNT
jgi:ribosomal protein S18 acetylase RimI-like enzyme